jgi:hypothetical protein
MRLKLIGYPHWFWFRISNWAYGERYKFRDGSIAYLLDGEIISVKRGAKILWRMGD